MTEKKLTFNLTGMTDDHSAESVIRAVNTVPGLISADVSVADARAVVVYDDRKATASDFTDAIDLEGYGATAV